MTALGVIAADSVKDAEYVEPKADAVEVPADVITYLEEVLAPIAAQVPISKISLSGMPGVYEVVLGNEQLIYINEQGSHFVVGDLYSLEGGKLANLSEKAREEAEQAFASVRFEKMQVLKQEDLIVFPAEGETKAVVTVFTDIDCGYCRKLHSEIEGYNKAGIEVRYAAFPRAGVGSNSYNKYVNTWCASDKLVAMTDAKKLKPVPAAECENPVAQQYQLGQEIGVKGTPAIVTGDGTLIPGYLPPDRLVERLGLNSDV